MNRRAHWMIPPIKRPQIVGIAAVLAAFLLAEFMVGELPGHSPVLLSNQTPATGPR
jgi:hypothetical protein